MRLFGEPFHLRALFTPNRTLSPIDVFIFLKTTYLFMHPPTRLPRELCLPYLVEHVRLGSAGSPANRTGKL